MTSTIAMSGRDSCILVDKMVTLIRNSLRTLGLSVVIGLAIVATAGAASDTRAPVTQSYGTDDTVQKGMIVRLDAKDTSKVSILKQEDSKKMFGVVVDANDAALSLTGNLDKRQVYVATFGKYYVLVSTQNGPIIAGESVSISSLNGIGMKADGDEDLILGKALTSFDGNGQVSSTATYKDGNGQDVKIALGRILVDVAVQENPLRSQGFPSALTQFLGDIGYTVTKKNVSVARLYLALVILIITAIVSSVLLFSAVRNAMISIGRNPLAKRDIIRGMIQVVMTSLIIFIIGIFGVYLLLKL